LNGDVHLLELVGVLKVEGILWCWVVLKFVTVGYVYPGLETCY